MVYYFNNTLIGIDKVQSFGEGHTIRVTWHQAYPSTFGNKIAYNIYYSTERPRVFAEGPKFVITDGYLEATMTDFTPGQLYHFGVRPIEYNESEFDYKTLPLAYDNLYVYPESHLRQNILSTSLIIPLIDVTGFPSQGIVKIGLELIRYLSVDSFNNNLVLSSTSQRGYLGTTATIHNTDGYDGYEIRNPLITIFPIGEDPNWDQVHAAESRFEYPNYSYTQNDGYKQVVKDLLTTDLSASDDFNINFPSYDYAGWHRTDPVLLLTGGCVGSYIGGEMFCADGYDGVGRVVRGLSVQDHNNQRQEMLLQITGEPVVLLQRQWTGIRCYCFQPSRETPDDRCPQCFVPGTMVNTISGYKNIEDIQIGELVLTEDGGYHKVTRTFKNYYDGYMKSITTSTTSSPIITTPEHPFKVLRGSHKKKIACSPKCNNIINNGKGFVSKPRIIENKNKTFTVYINDKYNRKKLGVFESKEQAVIAFNEYNSFVFEEEHKLEWDEAKNIKIGDWLVNIYDKMIIDLDYIKIPQECCKNTKLGMLRKGVEEFKVDGEFLWICGLYLAEGSAQKRSIIFALHKNETEYQNKIVEYFSKLGFNSKIRTSSDNGVEVEVYSTTLSAWFKKLFGQGCANKKIPLEFMKLPENKSMSLLKGIFDGDGTKRDNELIQTSKVLAIQVAELLFRCNKKPLTRKIINKVKTEKGNDRKIAYGVSFEKETLNRSNRRNTWYYLNNSLNKVKKIEDVYYSGYVYNLEVEDNHTYVVENILVHNCHGSGFVLGYSQYFNPRRSDGRLLVRFAPAEDDVKPYEAGLESEFSTEVWTLTVPTIKDRDILIRFDQEGNEEFRYEVLSVTRNKMLVGLQGGQKMRVQRIRKYDPAYQILSFNDTSSFPSKLNTNIAVVPGLPPHTHEIVINEKITSLSQINQTTAVSAGHNHVIRAGVCSVVLGHSHTIILP